MILDFSRCRLAPFKHQREDTTALVNHPYFFIASEMRTGKTKIVIDAAQFLFEAGLIDRVIVVAPAPVRDVWFDPQLGELAKHLWQGLPAEVTEYHAKIRTWLWQSNPPQKIKMIWLTTNFEFLRSKARLAELMPACGPRTLLVLDESSFVKNHAALQTKACMQLRKACGRVVLLNGTPLFHSPLDLFSQGNLLHPSVLDCKFITLFKARYAVQTPVRGFGGKALTNTWGQPILEVTTWTNLEDLERRFKRCTVRRLQKDCLDLPPKLDPVTLTATLSASWPHYKAMRDNLVVWLSEQTVATSATAAVKALRLSQITGGFLGGVEAAGVGEQVESGLLESLNLEGVVGRPILADVYEMIDALNKDKQENPYTLEDIETGKLTAKIGNSVAAKLGLTQEIGREKLDVLLWFIEQRLAEDPNLKLVAWGRFRAEVLRAEAEVRKLFPQFETAVIMGGQKKNERLRALALLKPETTPAGPVFVAGIEGTGSFGLDMCAAHTCVTMSGGYSPGRSAQTLDRVYGPGQKHPIAYYNIVAVGPKNQRTVDHDILVARMAGEDVARRTASAWVLALTEE